ncbi:NDMA-dependent alcohol dehydrogenase [Nocardia salmonicida]|uniref:alcohol dehydrogenase n=1 Tax=Nocardia salmonicida TaxID=53431 RepID=A0ABZ1N349_9NOCA
MRTRAAILRQQPGKWEIVDVELEEPRDREVRVRMAYAGLCHSDDHMAKGDMPANLPYSGGHEGSGVVEAVGPGVTTLAVGDHIVTSFVPSCGQCRWCASGMQNLCDSMADYSMGIMPDGTYRMWLLDGTPVKKGALGTFAERNIFPEASCIKIRDDISLDVACLTGCGVPTGWGSAVHSAEVQPGDVVIVMGIGGLGANALQGARMSGASRVIAVDLVAGKRAAAEEFGATDFTTSMDEATELARSLTNGQGADSAIITIGVIDAESIGLAFSAIRKAGTVVVTAQGNMSSSGIPVNHFELSMYQKRIQGVLYGTGSPRREVHRLLDLYADGRLKLKELITASYSLDEINVGYQDLLDGKNIRGVIDFSRS